MERYDHLGMVGEGSYGMVLKCRHKETSQIVAIKKFIESEDDRMVKKIAMREIRMLKQLRHENLVNLLEVFRRKKRLFLVFEFVDRTVLDDLEKQPEGLDDMDVKKISFQVLRGLEFCHSHNVIHRDVKPENILISNSGVVKLCDFGFARTLATGPGEVFTDYVATRWYRAPELLVGDVKYGKAVDIWAVGCLLFEMVTGDPLFPGDSDIDQLFHITKYLGSLTQRHQDVFHRNPLFTGMRLPNVKNPESFSKKFPQITQSAKDLIQKALSMEASQRPSCLEMMKHNFYQRANFATNFLEELQQKVEKETKSNPFLKSLSSQKENQHKNNTSESKENISLKTKKKDISKASSKVTTEKKKRKDLSKEDLFLNENKDDNKTKNEITTEKHNANRRSNNNENEKKEKAVYKKSPPASLTPSNEKYTTSSIDLERDKSYRMTLDLSINVPGQNLPELHNSRGAAAHGHDVLKNKKSHTKKSISRHDQLSSLCPVSEKAAIHIDRNKSIDDISFISEKFRKKENRKENNIDPDNYRASLLTLPSVKGAGTDNRSSKTSASRLKKPYATGIPHIQNIDPFSSPANSEVSSIKNNRDNNLPAV